MRPFPFPLLALAFLALSVSAAYIEPDVGNEIAKNGIAPVIVVLSEGPIGLGGGKREGKALVLDRLQDYVAAKLAGSEGPQFRQAARLQSGAFAAMKAEKVGRHVQAKRRFSSLPSFSADVDADGLRHLQRNRWVESVWFDRPVFADTAVSIPQINADDVQNYVRSGTNFTGHNQTICILDTGIDYTHEAFGACGSPVNGTSVDANVSWLNESAHPYSNSANTTVTFNSTAMGLGTYSRMAVHFANISLEPNYDHLFVEDSSGRVLASYSGNRTSFWSPSAEGDTVVLRLVSDADVTAYGFSVDLVNNGTTTADANWVCPKVAGGYDFVNNDFDPMDDASNSHGTHVSGIAAGNGTIRGVAPHARIASVKVLNSAGSGTSSDIVAGIDWCNTNRFIYNISVLSMSLGTVAVSSSYCDSVATSLAVQRAFGSGVFVSAASGNSGSSSGVSSPACSSNATAVGAVNSADGIASFSNTWANFMVLAPGNEVVSSTRNNNTASLPGTSMAAPHVAGAAALMQEFAQTANGSLATPLYVRNLLNRTGVPVSDARVSLYFSRIDALSALNTFLAEVSPRNITLESFTNASVANNGYAFVNVSFFDDNLTPSSCVLQWSNGSVSNFSMAIASGSCSYNATGQSNVNASFRVYLNDSYDNVGTAFFTRSLDTLAPQQVASTFSNNSVLGDTSVQINATFSDLNPHSCILELNGSNSSTAAGASSCSFTRAVANGTYNFTVYVNDSLGWYNNSGRYFFTIDSFPPASLALASPTLANNTNSTGSDVYVNLTFTEANPSNCILQFNNTNYTMSTSFGGNTAANRYCYYDVATLANGLNNYTAFVNDTAGNIVATGPYYVRLDSVYPTHLGFAGPTHSANNSNTSGDFVYVNLTYIETTPANCTLQFNNGTLANYSMSLTQNSSGGYCYYNVSSAFSTSGMIANYTVFVGDGAGQVNASALRVVRYDATAPASLALNTTGRNLANNSNFTGDFAYVNVTFSELNANNCVLQFNNTNYTMTASFGGVNPANRYCYYNMSTLANGLNNYTVFVNDTSGNIAATGPYYVRLDSAYPSALSVVFPTLANNSNTTLNYAYFNFTFSEANPANCTLEFNNGTAANYSMQLAGSGSGAYCYYNVTSAFSVSGMGANYTAYVFDGSGNSNATALRYVNFDNTAPSSILLVSPTFANGTYNTTDYIYANLSFTESSPSACTLQFNGTVNYSMALAGSGPSLYCYYNVTSLAEGVHNFTVFVNDTAGNSAASFRVIALDRTAPAISAVSASPSAINASLSFTISANASDSVSSVLNITLALTNSSGTQNYSTRASKSGITYTFSFASLALQDGNYTVNVSAWDNASNYASNASLNITFDSTPPYIALLSGEANSSGVISLNWSAGLDAASFGHFELYRNGSRLSSSTERNYTDSSAVYSAFYNYTMYAFDSVGNVNASNSAYVSANDTTYPRYTANLTATNLANGTVNLSWSNVTLDTSGQAERNATFFVYRTANTSSTNASNMTLLANTTLLYYSDSSALSASYSYLYAVATLDGNGNLNSTVAANNSVNQTTVSTCSNSFNDWSACSGGSQSRTRTCLGAAQTEAQSCSSGGASSTGSVTSAPVAGGAVSGGSGGGVSTGGARGGGGGSAGKGNQLFVIAEVPKAVEMKPGAEATMPVVISSFYTGFLNYVNVTLEGVPGDWYEVKPVKYVTPISNTSFDIVWRIPEEARGNYSVQVVLSGLGSKTLGILNTSYNFTLVLPPVKSVKPFASDETGKAADVGVVPSVAPSISPVMPAQTDYSQYYAVVGMLALSAMVFGAYELGRWKESPE